MKPRKILAKALSSPANLHFAEMQRLVEAFGFGLLRITASHHIYGRPGTPEQINIQEVDGKAKPYYIAVRDHAPPFTRSAAAHRAAFIWLGAYSRTFI